MLTERNGVAGKKRASAGRRLRSTTASAVMSRRCREARASDFLLMVRRGDVGVERALAQTLVLCVNSSGVASLRQWLRLNLGA